MICLVQSRTDEVGHTCIEDGELLVGALLHISHLTDQATALSYHRTTQFEVKFLIRIKFQELVVSGEVFRKVRDRQMIRMTVVDTQTTSYIDMLANDVMLHQLVLEFVHTVAKSRKIAHVQDL